MSDKEFVTVDPVTIIIKECINLSTAMRKYSKFTSQSGVAALLGGGSEIFSNQDDYLAHTFNNLNTNKHNDPFLSGFIQLRLMLNKLKNLDNIDSLTILQPFLLIVSTSSISGYITSLALDSLQKFFTLNIINESSQNYIGAHRATVNALTHCRFEGSQQLSDDSVLLKVVFLLRSIVDSPYGDLLSNSIIYDVLQTILSLACNNRRSEVLRNAAQSTMIAVTVKIFSKLKTIEPVNVNQIYINDESYTNDVLKADTIGTNVESKEEGSQEDPIGMKVNNEEAISEDDGIEEEHIHSEKSTNGAEQLDIVQKTTRSNSRIQAYADDNYGLPVVRQYLNLLLSLIAPENELKHSYSTRIFGLELIQTALEISGDRLQLYPRLFTLISDPIFKSILFIIQNTTKLSLLQATLQLFTTLVVILGNNLQLQIELTLTRIFSILLDDGTANNSSSENKNKPSIIKELLIEQISILWTRSPSFFTSTFINFDCNLDRADVSINFLKALTKLALPESALTTTESVPPICLEGLVSLVDDMFDHMKDIDREEFGRQKNEMEILKKRDRKTEFIECTNAFNEKPKKGIPMLIEKGFIASDSDKDIAEFLFNNNNRMNKKTIGLLLCHPDKVSLLNEYIRLFDFSGLRVDEAIRILLTKFRLPGESQQIERIIEAFSSAYCENQDYDPSKISDNAEDDISTVQPDADSVFILSYSIIMLNTDLHNPQVKEHMSFEDYSGNLKGCCNHKDFPFWYLDRIYCSIRDKEIVMPEEHHGNEKWFEDAWNNLISSTTVITEIKKDTQSVMDKLTPLELLNFDRAIFKQVGPSIVSTLFNIYVVASDDHISTRMITSLDKCSYISAFFDFKDLFNDILNSIAKGTTLINSSHDDELSTLAFEYGPMPLVQIKFEDTNTEIPVSTDAVRFGRSFKGQLNTVVFFRIIRRNKDPKIFSKELWLNIVNIILTLYEDLILSPDIFPDLQKRLKLSNLPKPSPEISINKSKESKGLLSTFASYLKGDEEPTEEEIKSSKKAMECIKSSNIAASVFGNESNITADLIKTLLDSAKTEKNADNSRYFEAELLFIIELTIALFLFCKEEKELGKFILQKVFQLSHTKGLTKRTVRRMLTYKILLISLCADQTEYLSKLINDELLKKGDIFTQKLFATNQGKEFLKRLFSLTESEFYRGFLLGNENFWKFLRKVTAMKEQSESIFEYLNESIKTDSNILTNENFMWVLGLLDEISSMGAVGNHWEIEYKKLTESGHKIDKENPYKKSIELSLKSIQLTSHLLEDNNDLRKNEIFAIIQALAHQCINPCKQISEFAVVTLEQTLINKIEIPTNEMGSVEELIEGGLLPLLNSSETQEDQKILISSILTIISNVYLHYLKLGKTSNETFLKILSIFNKFVEDSDIEKKLQQLILDKKSIEKGNGSSSHGSAQEQTPESNDVEIEATAPIDDNTDDDNKPKLSDVEKD
ncbi:Gea2p [Saccharomyces cerevisiae YJM1242]|nr:Gea2p [Saccharomyces cerevisiae YJM1242]AJU54924.1 Gea2p [Saccharomyces cerevisiae YJM1477]